MKSLLNTQLCRLTKRGMSLAAVILDDDVIDRSFGPFSAICEKKRNEKLNKNLNWAFDGGTCTSLQAIVSENYAC